MNRPAALLLLTGEQLRTFHENKRSNAILWRESTCRAAILVAGITAIIFLLVACVHTPGSKPPEHQMIRSEQQLDLNDKSANLLMAPPTRTGDRLEVSLDITQKNDPYTWCGKPALLDPAGNLVVALTPQLVKAGEQAKYGYSLIVVQDGLYVLQFANQECNVRGNWAKATVTWKVFRTPESWPGIFK